MAAPHPRFGPDPDRLDRIRDLIAWPGLPQLAWHTLLDDQAHAIGTPQTLALNAAFAHRVTGEPEQARLAFAWFERAADILATTSEGLLAGDITGHLALAYDFAYSAWTGPQRTYALRVFKRAAAFFAAYHWPNLDQDDDKASNWVAVVRGGELIMQLATRGEGDLPGQEARIAHLVDELRRHFEDGYGDSGWNQEGYDYLRYGLDTGGAPAVWAAEACGIKDLTAAWQRPRFAELILQTQSLRPAGDRVQFGVGERTGRPSPAFLGTGTRWTQAAYRRLFEQTPEPFAPGSTDPLWTLLRWPDTAPHQPARPTALFDDREGAYAFRNRYRNEDDTLIGVTNRNGSHFGWQQRETFALSMIGQGTTWARMPAKEWDRIELFSKPLIDGVPQLPSGADGQGRTTAARRYRGQGGGYVALDGGRNYGIAEARRELVVDMQGFGSVDTVLALHDRFADAVAHRIDWQLSPEPGVDITCGDSGSGALTFLFRRDDAWLKGWLLEPGAARLCVADGAFRIARTGRSADFRLVLALGRGTPPTAQADGTRLTLAGRSYDTDDLVGCTPGAGAAPGRLPVLELSVPPLPFQPGATRTITATLGWWDREVLHHPCIRLAVPAGWAAVELPGASPNRLSEGERATIGWAVTAPCGTPPGDYVLTATAPTDPQVFRTAAVSLVPTDLALGRHAEQSSTLGEATRATNGNLDGRWGHGSVSHTLEEVQPWWQTDLGTSAEIAEVVLWNRTDAATDRLRDFYVLVSEAPFGRACLAELLATPTIWRHHATGPAARTTTIPVGRRGRHVRIQLAGPDPRILALGEVQVLPPPTARTHTEQGSTT
ncbi:discoidin domain-containing protein [Streptomyces sp. TRM66268-LWL]|uniref:Discoidin domain-containing protein n=1 Tax=Streptomyces polyasparticus TaxID=2767826 RepID=A0ABR7SYU0_9ACTN|nr:NEW3 domain-containing protein [Streptomyces polyasparticus]MBC9719438.1 discoidin domain-containing protein [Streptomyces polyasparticus]